MGRLNQNFITWKGNYREIRFLVEDVATVEDCEAEWGMSVDPDSVKLIKKSTQDSPPGIALDGKHVIVKLYPEDTDDASGIADGSYYHELRLVDAHGNPSTPAIGTVDLRPVILKGD